MTSSAAPTSVLTADRGPGGSAPSPAPAADAAPAPRPRSGRLLALDGLRLFAALFVLLYHFTGGSVWRLPPDDLGWLGEIARYGWLGVQLFFLISGFVICMSSWGRSVGEFAISRVVRLYPAYWLAVLVTGAVVYLVPDHPGRIPVKEVLANLTMVQERLGVRDLDAAYWTLAVELQFYLLFAVVVWRGVTYRRVVLFSLLWLVATVSLEAAHVPALPVLLAIDWAPFFIAGMTIYLMHRFGPTLLLWVITAACWLLAVLQMAKVHVDSAHGSFAVRAAIVTVFFAILIAVALGALNWVRWRGMVTAGALTYPLYLLHETLGRTVIRSLRGLAPSWVLLLGLVAGMLALAYAVQRWWERPVARWMRAGLLASLARIRTS